MMDALPAILSAVPRPMMDALPAMGERDARAVVGSPPVVLPCNTKIEDEGTAPIMGGQGRPSGPPMMDALPMIGTKDAKAARSDEGRQRPHGVPFGGRSHHGTA